MIRVRTTWPSPRATALAPARLRWPCSAAAATALHRILRHHRHRHRHRLSTSRPSLAAVEALAAVVTCRASIGTTCLCKLSASHSATRNHPASATSFMGTLVSAGYWGQGLGKDQSTGFWVRPDRRHLRKSTRGGAIFIDFALSCDCLATDWSISTQGLRLLSCHNDRWSRWCRSRERNHPRASHLRPEIKCRVWKP